MATSFPASNVSTPRPVIALAATFTAEPIEDFVAFWMRELDVAASIEFAPFDQVFQQLLDPNSQLSRNRSGVNVLLVRIEDLCQLEAANAGLHARLVEFAAAVAALIQRTATPILVYLAPGSPAEVEDADRHLLVTKLEVDLAARLGGIAGVHVVTSAELVERFPRESYYAAHTDAQGSVPYTPRFFAALGTHLARRVMALWSTPRKVIVLDCDDTLWEGICGEDGWANVKVDAPRRALQAFMLRQHDAGVLLCVSSKNNAADVKAVFDNHPDMLLRPEHITAWRVNWNRKSENLRSLAAALGLALDSFIVVDDSPVELAEVETQCPEALLVRLPSDPRLVPSFLENFWAFDRPVVTDEDKRRTAMYQQNVQREDLRSVSSGLRSFLEGLELEIEIVAMQPQHVSRVAQLTQRTTQFNLRPIGRSEAEVHALLRSPATECLVVQVRDRFGDYGLVGALVAEALKEPGELRLDTMLLSCRALGRGVEHRMLATFGELARELGIPMVEVPMVETTRNRPAREFMERLAGPFGQPSASGLVYRLPAEVASAASVEEWLDEASRADAFAADASEASTGEGRQVDREYIARLHRIATTLDDEEKVLSAVEASRGRPRPSTLPAHVAPRTPIERELARLWVQVLGVREVGVDDDFFDLGGHSILAMELISRVGDAFGVELPMRSMFDTPTLAQLAATITALTDVRLDEGQSSVGLPVLTPNPDAVGEPFPLTDIQQAYWVGRTGGFELGNIAAHFYIEVDYPDLDVARLTNAWQRLIERHGMLRAIVMPDGRQHILERVPEYQVEVLDVRGLAPARAEEELASLRSRLSHEVRQPDQWPLFEIRAARLEDGRVRVYYSFDLLIADAASLLILTREAYALYRDPTATLEPLAMSFRDYVLADAAIVDSAAYQRSLDYWRRRLPDLPGAPELPLSTPPSAVEQPCFVRYSSRLDVDRWQRLKKRAARAGLTPTTVVLCAYADVIGRWSKSPRFTLNLTVLNRLPLHEQMHLLVGDFTTVELLAVDTTAGGSFEARAAGLQQQLWEDLDHRHVGGIRLIREMARGRDAQLRASMPVVFTSTLNLGGDDGDSVPFAIGGSPVFGVTQTPQVWLDCGVFQQAGDLIVNWDAVQELFPDGMVADMFGSLSELLSRLADDDAAWQSSARLGLPAAQRLRRDLVNATAGPLSTELLHAPFLEQARRRPDAPAVITSTRSLSYGEVRRRSVQLGHELHRLGVRPNELVAVVMDKGWEEVVATLGILQSGAAYLPLDPGLPNERLRYLLEHGEVRIALTQPWVDARVTWPDGIERVHVAGEAPTRDLEPIEVAQSPDDLAYVIFTSGSTGVPKGVMIDHRGALNTLLDLNERFEVGPEERVFGLSALSFDLSVYDIFGTLAAGGALVLPDAGGMRDPGHWSELLRRERVSLWNSVPALMQMLVEYAADRPHAFPAGLRLVWLSGDWIPVALPERIRALRPGVELVSMGGATEASIWSIMYPIDRVESDWKSIPYGKPLRNQTFHVLDEALEACPVWVPGQLYIGGTGLAQGYWRDSTQTREKFVVHPRTGERLYRTGDLGRYLADDNIEFLGREDFQVKIQGFRVELGEIEATLAKHPGVGESVVVAREGPSAVAGKRLVAYVVPADGESVGASELRDFLAAKLPAYMVPSDCMVLADFPLTSNGKVDRRALPAPEYARPQLGEAFPFQGPRDAVETELVEIWERALGVRPIGITDDFFELGGHSLLAANVFGEIAKRYGRDLPLATLFRQPTIAELATVLRSEAAQASWSPLVSIRATGSKPPFFCLHSAGGNVLEYYPLAKHLGPDQPFYALQSEGLDGGPAEPSRLEDMAARYLGAIRAVQPRGPYRLGGFCFGGMLAFEVAQQLLAIGQDVTLVAMIENPTGDYGCSLPGTTPLQRQMHRAGQRVLLELGNLGPLDQRAKLAYAVQRARRLLSLGGVGVERLVHPLLERTRLGRQLSRAAAFEELIAAHGRAYSRYVPHSYPGRVVVFRASEQAWGVAPDPAMGWTGLLPDEPEVRVVPGQHKNILKEPWVTALADQLQACLDAPATTRQRSSSELELVTSDTGHLPHETFTSAQPDRDVHLRVC